MRSNRRSYLTLFFIFLAGYVLAQETIVTGVVRDSETKEPLPYVNIFFTGTNVGVTSDPHGKYRISTDKPYTQIQFSFVGYEPVIRALRRGEAQVINVALKSESVILEEVVVKSGREKEKYRNKNNPAVDLIRNVIDNKEKNQIQAYDYVEYEQYEKLQFSLSSLVEKLKEKKL